MRVISNQRHIRIHRGLATVSSIGGAILLFITLFIAMRSPEEIPPLGLAVPAVILSAVGLRMSYYWLRIPTPLDALEQGLKGFGSDCVLYHHFLPAPHVLVCPYGVFSLTVKPQRVGVRVENDVWTRTEGKLSQATSAIMTQNSIGNPGREATRQAEKLQGWLRTHIPDHNVQVQPIVVFTNPEAQLTAHQPNPPVAYAYKRKPTLKAAIRGMPKRATLTSQQITELERAAGITSLTQTSTE